MRKYGRVLIADEGSDQWWIAQDETEEQAAYDNLYAEEKDWIDNFLFQSRYYQNLVFDPESNTAEKDWRRNRANYGSA